MNSADRAVSEYIAMSLAEDLRHSHISSAVIDFKVTPAIRRVMVRIAVAHFLLLGIRACRECACTENMACERGCSWVESNLCSSCAPRPRKRRRGSA